MPENLDNIKQGTQTLWRGIEIIEAVAIGHKDILSISQYIQASRSTTHRLASTLVELRYLRFSPLNKYSLGPKLIELGMMSLQNYPLRIAAYPHLEALAKEVGDTVHLGLREKNEVLYLEKISGNRAFEMRSKVGYRMPLISTGIGKSLIIDCSDKELTTLYLQHNDNSGLAAFMVLMHTARQNGFTLDLEENEMAIRCVAAPIRDAMNTIVAAISVASYRDYMPDDRMSALSERVKIYAALISEELGWQGKTLFSPTLNSQRKLK
ncbi:IclR family transcriptional regulator [Citrobacter amalonaticus]|uniref:IclR family transcriptional regulator n=1 Tax=Citrobacter amalonaticus TaxID=35703 RepID=UPI00207D1335|nr:IclR family transcriptional regulator [Citrobacter amalonaticus]MCO4157008.1 IclR family transcriptional regulator [Citrobacter amalonaticus]